MLSVGHQTGLFDAMADGTVCTSAQLAERAAFLTRAAGRDNLALQTQYIALLGRVEDQIVACFRPKGAPFDIRNIDGDIFNAYFIARP